ncbi:uncharacterized protein KY384_006129 [Bacidia gigantensis]|uniref:uncharacterized protein n=1 Tax=Bacidia gigantensis TaxID=2732470 RepID=UPI001D048D93|nr:uncharacterized protein KY384_006129 [Bacidia gigantensis]KAG8529492.1 hypothetical protein KY384_006129 [Bacidia gigantensis]
MIEPSPYTAAPDYPKERLLVLEAPSSSGQRSGASNRSLQRSTHRQDWFSEGSPRLHRTQGQISSQGYQEYSDLHEHQGQPNGQLQTLERDMGHYCHQESTYMNTRFPDVDTSLAPSHKDARQDNPDPYYTISGPLYNASSFSRISNNVLVPNKPWSVYENNAYGQVSQEVSHNLPEPNSHQSRRISGPGMAESPNAWDSRTEYSHNNSQSDSLIQTEDSQQWPIDEPVGMQGKAQPLPSRYVSTHKVGPIDNISNTNPLSNNDFLEPFVPQINSQGYTKQDPGNRSVYANCDTSTHAIGTSFNDYQSSQYVSAPPDSSPSHNSYGNNISKQVPEPFKGAPTQNISQTKGKGRKGRKLTPLTDEKKTDRAYIRRVGACSVCKEKKIGVSFQ